MAPPFAAYYSEFKKMKLISFGWYHVVECKNLILIYMIIDIKKTDIKYRNTKYLFNDEKLKFVNHYWIIDMEYSKKYYVECVQLYFNYSNNA